MPASRTVKPNSKINIYFSAEEKMNSVLKHDGKFISTPHGEGREEAGSLNKEEIIGLIKSP